MGLSSLGTFAMLCVIGVHWGGTIERVSLEGVIYEILFGIWNRKDKSMRKWLLKNTLIFFLMVAIGCALLILAFWIPNRYLKKNVRLSKEVLERESIIGGWEEIFTHGWSGNLDSPTDRIIIDESEKDETKTVIQAAFSTYPRMWNGYLIVIRPLLVFFSYSQIRYILYVAVFLMVWMVSEKISKRLGKWISFGFVVSLLLINVLLVPYNIMISCCLIVTLLASEWVVSKYDSRMRDGDVCSFFFTTGITEIYFDMLTAPCLTLGIPLILLLLIRINEEHITDIKQNISLVIKSSIAWGGGYGCFWASKWIVTTIITGHNVVAEAINQVRFRAQGDTGQNNSSLFAIEKNLAAVLPTHGENLMAILCVICIVVLIMVVIFVKKRRKNREMKCYLPILLVSLYPIAWWALIANHSIIHATIYSYRLTMILFLGMFSIYFSMIGEKTEC